MQIAKPRIFVSSTYYDLNHVRRELERFIELMGYEAVLFERGAIPYDHDVSLDESCYQEIPRCNMLVLLLGGRYGSNSSRTVNHEENDEQSSKDEVIKKLNSITRQEYEEAIKENIPLYTFVQSDVLTEYRTFKRNEQNPKTEYAYVDNVLIFDLIDKIYAEKRNNFLTGFNNVDDIISFLRQQWAGLFHNYLSAKSQNVATETLKNKIDNLESTFSDLLQSFNKMSGSNGVDVKALLEDLKKDQFNRDEKIALKGSKLYRHLIERVGSHSLTPEKIEEIYYSAKTLKDFTENLKKADKNKGCWIFNTTNCSELDYFIRTRKV